MHSEWKECMQGRVRSSSPSPYSDRHTVHVSAVEPSAWPLLPRAALEPDASAGWPATAADPAGRGAAAAGAAATSSRRLDRREPLRKLRAAERMADDTGTSAAGAAAAAAAAEDDVRAAAAGAADGAPTTRVGSWAICASDAPPPPPPRRSAKSDNPSKVPNPPPGRPRPTRSPARRAPSSAAAPSKNRPPPPPASPAPRRRGPVMKKSPKKSASSSGSPNPFWGWRTVAKRPRRRAGMASSAAPPPRPSQSGVARHGRWLPAGSAAAGGTTGGDSSGDGGGARRTAAGGGGRTADRPSGGSRRQARQRRARQRRAVPAGFELDADVSRNRLTVRALVRPPMLRRSGDRRCGGPAIVTAATGATAGTTPARAKRDTPRPHGRRVGRGGVGPAQAGALAILLLPLLVNVEPRRSIAEVLSHSIRSWRVGVVEPRRRDVSRHPVLPMPLPRSVRGAGARYPRGPRVTSVPVRRRVPCGRLHPPVRLADFCIRPMVAEMSHVRVMCGRVRQRWRRHRHIVHSLHTAAAAAAGVAGVLVSARARGRGGGRRRSQMPLALGADGSGGYPERRRQQGSASTGAPRRRSCRRQGALPLVAAEQKPHQLRARRVVEMTLLVLGDKHTGKVRVVARLPPMQMY
ncbi:hypothetical protein BU14_0216s0020, partial [Porphyra umbilicalis]